MESPDTLKQRERDTLNQIETSYQELYRRVEAFNSEQSARMNEVTSMAYNMAVFGTVSPAQVMAANENLLRLLQGQCEAISQWQNYFLSFEPTARALGEAGLPTLAIRLSEIETDRMGALTVYQEMCASGIQQMRANAAIWSGAAQYTAGTIQQVISTQRGVFELCRTRWDNQMFNKCPRCGSFLQSRSLPYCWSCNLLVVRF